MHLFLFTNSAQRERFQYVRRVYTTSFNFPCIITLNVYSSVVHYFKYMHKETQKIQSFWILKIRFFKENRNLQIVPHCKLWNFPSHFLGRKSEISRLWIITDSVKGLKVQVKSWKPMKSLNGGSIKIMF